MFKMPSWITVISLPFTSIYTVFNYVITLWSLIISFSGFSQWRDGFKIQHEVLRYGGREAVVWWTLLGFRVSIICGDYSRKVKEDFKVKDSFNPRKLYLTVSLTQDNLRRFLPEEFSFGHFPLKLPVSSDLMISWI